MAMFRQFQTSFWSDNYIGDLSPNQKLLYVYILTNEKTTQCGVYEFSMRYAQLETGLDKAEIEQIINEFVKSGKIRYSKETNEILIINWLKHNSARSPKVAAVVDKEIRNIKTPEFESEVITRSQVLGYPIQTKLPSQDTVSIPYPYSIDSGTQYNIKEDKKNIKEVEVETDAPATADAYQIFQENFGMLNSFNSQSITEWIQDFGSDELVIEAMRRSALDNKGYRYAEGIMKKWVSTNIKTLDDVKAEDVLHERSKQSKNGRQQVIETIPDEFKDEYKPEHKKTSPEELAAIQEQMARLEKSKQ